MTAKAKSQSLLTLSRLPLPNSVSSGKPQAPDSPTNGAGAVANRGEGDSCSESTGLPPLLESHSNGEGVNERPHESRWSSYFWPVSLLTTNTSVNAREQDSHNETEPPPRTAILPGGQVGDQAEESSAPVEGNRLSYWLDWWQPIQKRQNDGTSASLKTSSTDRKVRPRSASPMRCTADEDSRGASVMGWGLLSRYRGPVVPSRDEASRETRSVAILRRASASECRKGLRMAPKSPAAQLDQRKLRIPELP